MPVRQEGRVSVVDNVVFGRGGGRDLRCDVFLPPSAGHNRAAVVLVHGGGWVQGDRTQLHYYGIQLARYGFVCICPEYRLSGESIWPAQIHDVKAAIRWLRANADTYGIDERRICISGNSAGGHLALIAAADTDAEFEGNGGNPDVSSAVAATVAIYPPTQLRVVAPNDMVGLLLGGHVERRIEDQASPLSYATATFPPTMLVHGNADELVPVAATLQMHDALGSAGAAVEMHVFDGQIHAFDTDPDYARQVADLIALFFDRKVRR